MQLFNLPFCWAEYERSSHLASAFTRAFALLNQPTSAKHRTSKRITNQAKQRNVTTAALIVAAGRGNRAGGPVPKQYAMLGGASVLRRGLETFAGLPEIDLVQVVIHPGDVALYEDCITNTPGPEKGMAKGPATGPATGMAKLLPPAHGAATRQLSVLAGLEALAAFGVNKVLIHDAARPFVGAPIIRSVISALDQHPGALAAVPLADTLKRADADGLVAETLPRAGLWRAQTPQGFRFGAILAAHRRAAACGRDDFTDDAAIAEWAGLAVALIADDTANTKITTQADLEMAERSMMDKHPSSPLEPRVGTGFDVHRFAAGDSVWLCGVRIPHSHRLDGHSDADVGLHALTDALLGAIGDGDIGQHFPPSDPQWKGAASHLFLSDAARRVRERGGRIVNVDVTLLCEAPRIGPHRAAMQSRIAEILGISPDRVGVKATTTEQLGFTGRREGIAAMATAMVLLG